MLEISAIPACIQNYIWVFHSRDRKGAWVLDPGDTDLVKAWMKKNNKELAGILVTHHHWDHTDGIEGLISQNVSEKIHENIPVYAPGKTPLAYTTNPLFEGDRVDIGWLQFEVLELPGHTQNHIAYLSTPNEGPPLLFCGDILFSAGCGRLKDGTAEQLHDSLQRLKQLPEDTQIYCGHEYTVVNLGFAQRVEPSNKNAREHLQHCISLREKGLLTLPSSLEREKLINPFLRTSSSEIANQCKDHFGITPQNSVECFAALRKWKDNFA